MAEREITFAAALREALEEEMRRDSAVFLMGQVIHYSIWGVTRDMQKEFGTDRVMEMPISENGFCAAAVGAAMTGMRPVVELMYGDFLLLAGDAICNQAAKYRYMCGGGDFKVPVTYRLAGCGTGSGAGCHHAQYTEAWGLHTPGLKVVVPSTPYSAKGLLKTAIRDNNPVLFYEYKQLYRVKGSVPEQEYTIPFGQARVAKEGKDLTIVAFAMAYHKAMQAAEKLMAEGIDVEVIDPQTLLPFDKITVINSLQKTNKLMIVEDDCKTGGVGAEIAAIISEEALMYLDAPIRRVAGADTPLPSGRHGEALVVPSVDDIVKAAQEMVR